MIRSVVRNAGLILGGKAGAGLISLVYLALASRALGPRDFGVLVLLNTYVLFVGGVIGIPGWQAIVRFGSMARLTDDGARLMKLLRFTTLVELGAGAVAVAVAAIAAPLIGPRLGWSPDVVALSGPYSLAVLSLVRTTPLGLLHLQRRFDLIAVHNLVMPLTRLAGTAIVLGLGFGLRGFVVAWLVAALLEGASLWLLGGRVLRDAVGRDRRLRGGVRGARDENPGLLRFMIVANADVTLAGLLQRAVPLTIGWVLGPAAAGLFSIAQRVTVIFVQPATILGQASYAEFAQKAASGLRREIGQGLFHATGLMLLVAVPLFALIALLPEQAVALLGGSGFAAAAGILVWLALAQLILLPSPALTAALTALGRPGLSVTANLAATAITYPLLPLLLNRMGLAAAGLQAIAQAVITIALLAFAARRLICGQEGMAA